MTNAVLLSNLSRHYGDVVALDGIDLEILEGEFFALLGPSGSGKTTCLRLIAGFENPTAGHIEIFGQSVDDIPPYRRSVNTVFQDYALFPHLTVLDNVAYGLMVRGIEKKEREAAAEQALVILSLNLTYPDGSAIRPFPDLAKCIFRDVPRTSLFVLSHCSPARE